MNQSPEKASDAELLRLMLAGDGRAFALLYERWQGSVYRFALRIGESEAMAEDVTQDVFLTLMREGGQYAGRGSFVAYLLTITRHSVLRRLQRERRFVALPEEPEREAEPDGPEWMHAADDPLAALTREERIDAVRRAVLELPLPYREVVLLCHLHELSYAEAAEVLGCGIGTVSSRLHRARALLAERLNGLRAEPNEALTRAVV